MDLGFFARLVFPRPFLSIREKMTSKSDLEKFFSEMREMQVCFDVVPDNLGVPLAVDPVYKRGSFGCFLHRKFSGPCWWKPRSQRQWPPESFRNAAIRRWASEDDASSLDEVRDFAALDLAGTPLSTSTVPSDASSHFEMVSRMSLREFSVFITQPSALPSNCDSQGVYVCRCGFYLGWDRLQGCECWSENGDPDSEGPDLWSGYAYDDLDSGFQQPSTWYSEFGAYRVAVQKAASLETVLERAPEAVNELISRWGADRGTWHPFREQGLARSFALFDVALTRIHHEVGTDEVFSRMISAMDQSVERHRRRLDSSSRRAEPQLLHRSRCRVALVEVAGPSKPLQMLAPFTGSGSDGMAVGLPGSAMAPPAHGGNTFSTDGNRHNGTVMDPPGHHPTGHAPRQWQEESGSESLWHRILAVTQDLGEWDPSVGMDQDGGSVGGSTCTDGLDDSFLSGMDTASNGSEALDRHGFWTLASGKHIGSRAARRRRRHPRASPRPPTASAARFARCGARRAAAGGPRLRGWAQVWLAGERLRPPE